MRGERDLRFRPQISEFVLLASVFILPNYPGWHPDGRLVIVSERRGRHDLYLVDGPK